MWSIGVGSLGLSSQDFWRLTLAQFNALISRYNDEQRRRDYRAAQICSVLAEIYRDRKKRVKPFSPQDFMVPEEKEEMDNPKMKRALERISQILGGENG